MNVQEMLDAQERLRGLVGAQKETQAEIRRLKILLRGRDESNHLDEREEVRSPRRLAIVRELGKGDLCFREIQERIGLEQAATSYHLNLLRLQDWVTCRRDRKNRIYSLTDRGRGLIGSH